ncbi:MAG: hypothetical protein M3307_05135 [Thermoproteota archaeon]|nr:hypothetical protein [Thermoproteota archaeon]
MATCSNNNNNISLLTSETNLLGADNNQAGKVLTGEEEEADNHGINIDRAIKGFVNLVELSHLSALGCTALIWFQRDFHN